MSDQAGDDPATRAGELEEEARTQGLVIAKAILSGQTAPYDGARRIWMDIHPVRAESSDGPLLARFIGLATEWEEHESDRPEIEAGIREAARGLVTRLEQTA